MFFLFQEHGNDKYNNLVDIRKLNNSREGYIEKHGIDKYNQKINNIKKSFRNRNFNKISKNSTILFQSIEKEINEKCFYGKERTDYTIL